MSSIEVRPARPGDRDAVLAFCTQTWDWGDYIEYVWDEWLTNSDGLLLVATVNGQPAGIARMEMLTPTDAWFEGLRVDPQFRQQGLARALNEGLLIEAMQRGATYARLAVESENARSIQITERAYWRRIGAFTLFTAPSGTTSAQKLSPDDQPRLATIADLDMIVDFLNVSNVFPLVGGVYYVRFKAYPITIELLEEKIAARQISLLYRWDRLDGLAIAETRTENTTQRLSVGYIDGTAIEPISLLAHDLRRQAAALGQDEVRVFAPDLILIRDAFTGVGYQDESIFYTYERGLE